MPTQNMQVLLAKRPRGPVDDDCFNLAEGDVPQPGDGEFLTRVEWLSIDPTIRMWMAMDTYLPAIPEGAPIRSAGIARIVESEDPAFPVGARVFGFTGWQEYAVMSTRDRIIPDSLDPSAALSVFGTTGLTAYFGLLDIGCPEPGDTLLVSAAAGSTGSIVGQIGKIKGCRVIGIAGSAEKCAWLTEQLGFDGAINYKNDDLAPALSTACPDGIDIYFDNVGGPLLEIAIDQLAQRGRIVLCGAISQYESHSAPQGPRNVSSLISKRGRMEGFLVLDYFHQSETALADLARWVGQGMLQYRVDIEHGLASAPRALQKMLRGENSGKQLVQL